MKQLTTSALLLSLALSSPIALGHVNDRSSVVSKKTCSRMSHSNKPFILVLDSGDNLHDSINQCVQSAHLSGASISGLGQLHNPVLAYFSSNPTDIPTLTHLSGYYELASINGNVSKNGSRYYTHLHGVLADKKFHGIAGHIDTALVGQTVELTIIPLQSTTKRTVDSSTGFGPLVH